MKGSVMKGYNQIGDEGAESLAGVLGQCAALAHLDLSNQISHIYKCIHTHIYICMYI
jgi:hypothetical protein